MTEIDLFSPSPSPAPSPERPPPASAARAQSATPSSPSNDTLNELSLDLSIPTSTARKRPSTVLDSDDEADDHIRLVQTLTKQQGLNTNSGLELERFSRLNLQQQLIMLHATTLAVKETLTAQSGAAAWVIPAELEGSIGKYTLAFVYSANCRAYKKWAPDTILAAMRAGKVALPPDSDVGRLEKILKRIGDKLTDHRSELKRKVKDSIPAGTDIATLAAEVVNGSGVKLTVEFYLRLAWLRFYGPDAGFDQKNFWDRIDQLLEKAREKFPGEKYTAHFKSIYRKDVKKFGHEATNVVVIDAASAPHHQRLVEKTATEAVSFARKRACVQRQNPPTAPAPAASSSTSNPIPE